MSNQEATRSSDFPVPPEINAAEWRERLVFHLVNEGALRSPAIKRAFAEIPREIFLPSNLPLSRVYSDDAIVVKWDANQAPSSSSTQPLLMADMLETLQLAPGMRVLEIGAGVGYNAAIITNILGDGSQLTSVDLDPAMVETARQNLQTLAGLLGPAYEQVRLVAADGSSGYAPDAPYDRIIVTVQQWEISPFWVEQLRTGGILLLPLTISTQVWGGLIPAFRKDQDGLLRAIGASHGGFMPMRGTLAHPHSTASFRPSGLLPLPARLSEMMGNRPAAPLTPGAALPLFLSGLEVPPALPNLLNKGDIHATDEAGPAQFSFGPADNQRAGAQAYYGFIMLLAAAWEKGLFFNLVQAIPSDPKALAQPSGSGEAASGWRYEPHGLALLVANNGPGYDLVTFTAADSTVQNYTKIAQSWRLMPAGLASPAGRLTLNLAMERLHASWAAWERMGRPTPVQYRPLAFPSSQPAPVKGVVVARKFYNILFPT